jgi:NADPH:quinone reductase-like Zn-dependent oxidoreductase
MKAVVFNKYGGNEVIEVRQVQKPEPGAHDVLIKVHAAAINPVDWKIRSGMAKILTGFNFPKILGSECSGEIVETGNHVKDFKSGDEIIGFPGIRRLSAFAEYVSVHERNTFTKPANISFEEAATIPVAGLTALQSLRNLGHVSHNSRVLINGASGGVGTFAVQIARIFGAHVTAVCSSANADLLKGIGADDIIDYTEKDFTKGDERYDIIFDTVSKRSFRECKRVLKPHGIYVNTLPVLSVLLNQYLTGFLMGKKAKSVMVRPNAADMEWMRINIESGKMRIIIDRVYSLDQIVEALAYSETGKARGKIVLKVHDS